MNQKEKVLRLVRDLNDSRSVSNVCEGCCDAKRQLEHVKMCLNAALLAASKPLNHTPTKGSP